METNNFLDALGDVKRENAINRLAMTEEQAEAYAEVFKEGFCAAMSFVAEVDPREMVPEIELYNAIYRRYLKIEWAHIINERNKQE